MSDQIAGDAMGPPHATKTAWRTMPRHRWPLRCMHWINLLCMIALVGSGLQIFNAHPALYWGATSTFDTPLASIRNEKTDGGVSRGVTRIGDHVFDTTGVLGQSEKPDGSVNRRAFPSWAVIPSFYSLALGRRWHFFFAWLWVVNGLCFLTWALLSRHLSRDLAMHRRDWRGIPRSIIDHLRFRHPVGEEALRYNPLQKLAYLAVIFVLAPLAVLTGLSMSPQTDTMLGPWLDLIGGRQSARTLHFVVMASFVAFVLIHVIMVVYAGPVNEMRSMITGRFRVRDAAPPAADPVPATLSTEAAP